MCKVYELWHVAYRLIFQGVICFLLQTNIDMVHYIIEFVLI